MHTQRLSPRVMEAQALERGGDGQGSQCWLGLHAPGIDKALGLQEAPFSGALASWLPLLGSWGPGPEAWERVQGGKEHDRTEWTGQPLGRPKGADADTPVAGKPLRERAGPLSKGDGLCFRI